MRNFHAAPASSAMRLLHRFTASEGDAVRGVAAIEFAMVVPLLILGIIGVADLGMGIYRKMQVQNAAQAGAQYAVSNGFNATSISTSVTNATAYSSIKALPAPIQFCGCATLAAVTVVTCGSICSSGSPAGTYVKVSAAATYYPSLLYSTIFPKSFALNAQSTVRIQ